SLRIPLAFLTALTAIATNATPQILVQGGRVVAPGQQNREIVAQFDADKDGRLNPAERAAARESIGTFGGGRGGGRFGGNRPAPSPGVPLTPSDVQNYPNAPIYDPATLRTFFIQFDND